MNRLRRNRRADEGGYAVIMVLSLMLLGVIVLTISTTAVMSEVVPTMVARKRVQTLAAAESGQNVALAMIRSASVKRANSDSIGDQSKLPCTTASSPITGEASGLSGLSYSVQVAYYTIDPTGQTPQWRASNALACSNKGPSTVPLYALITSTAVVVNDTSRLRMLGNRAVELVYTFSRSDAVIVGGPIRLLFSPTLCASATAFPPAAGTPITVQTCNPSLATQKFSYRPDFTIALTNTQNLDGTGGMCVALNRSATYKLSFAACGPLGWDPKKPTYIDQRWGFNGYKQFFGLNTSGTAADTATCWNASATVNATFGIYTCGNGIATYLDPDAKVGSSSSGASNYQLLNYQEFGRCLDITHTQVSWEFLISYPCKLDPSNPAPEWNQRFTWDQSASKQIQVNNGGGLYCLTTGATTGSRVLTKACSSVSAPAQNQQWIVNGDTGARFTAYTITDYAGRCLSLGPPDPTLPAYSTIVIETCDGSDEQKWNAPPVIGLGTVNGYREVPAS